MVVVLVVEEDPEQAASASVKAKTAHTAHRWEKGLNSLIMGSDHATSCASETIFIICGIGRGRNRIYRPGARSASSRLSPVRINTIAMSSE